ncbi:hypothetical protein BHE74_00012348 [Ensete ventricosum]|nr:hypothetical protein GW17_00008707 [Ensete ventricosum]RWW79376.1 hypothetical protein BHE74_00012348 [Ensete ventricosum]RZR83623.1 hypothetical protein BHM03_00010297 [Ensete ventricosum]
MSHCLVQVARRGRFLALLIKSRPLSVETAEYAKRNYANNVSEYNTVIGSLIAQRRQAPTFGGNGAEILLKFQQVNLYNFLISTCGKCKSSDTAIKVSFSFVLKGETYICLLNALAATGRTDQVYAIVRDMTAAGLGLNKFCYAGLITAFRNKLPTTEETTAKVCDAGFVFSFRICYIGH